VPSFNVRNNDICSLNNTPSPGRDGQPGVGGGADADQGDWAVV
jgi:hypothetical protein